MAFDANAELLESRALTSMMQYLSVFGSKAYWILHSPTMPICLITFKAVDLNLKYSRFDSVCDGATTIESPVCTPNGSKFSILQTVMQLSRTSRTTCVRQSMRLLSIRRGLVVDFEPRRITRSKDADAAPRTRPPSSPAGPDQSRSASSSRTRPPRLSPVWNIYNITKLPLYVHETRRLSCDRHRRDVASRGRHRRDPGKFKFIFHAESHRQISQFSIIFGEAGS